MLAIEVTATLSHWILIFPRMKMDELELVIGKSKINKSPGPSGFTNEFVKLFIHELSMWLLRAYNDSFKNGYLTRNTVLGTITCIAKSGK